MKNEVTRTLHVAPQSPLRRGFTSSWSVFGGKFYFVSVASLDDADLDELAAAPIRYVDGWHDRFDQPPEDTRLM